MGIIILKEDLAINEKDFERLEITSKSDSNSETMYYLKAHVAGKIVFLRSSKDYAECRLAFYWYSYLIGSCKDNIVEFTLEDISWFSTLLSNFTDSFNSQVDKFVEDFCNGFDVSSLNDNELGHLKDPNRVEIKRIKYELIDEFRERIKGYISKKYQ